MSAAAAPVLAARFRAAGLLSTAIAAGSPCLAAEHLLNAGNEQHPPFCAHDGRLEAFLARSGFAADDTTAFGSGASFRRYRHLGDLLWVARWPDGESCLVGSGLLTPKTAPFLK